MDFRSSAVQNPVICIDNKRASFLDDAFSVSGLALSLSHTHTHILSLSLSVCLRLSLPLSLTHTHTYTSLSLRFWTTPPFSVSGETGEILVHVVDVVEFIRKYETLLMTARERVSSIFLPSGINCVPYIINLYSKMTFI